MIWPTIKQKHIAYYDSLQNNTPLFLGEFRAQFQLLSLLCKRLFLKWTNSGAEHRFRLLDHAQKVVMLMRVTAFPTTFLQFGIVKHQQVEKLVLRKSLHFLQITFDSSCAFLKRSLHPYRFASIYTNNEKGTWQEAQGVTKVFS